MRIISGIFKGKKILDPLDIKIGLNLTDELIIFKDKEISIYDRICDHNSGKLISKNNKNYSPTTCFLKSSFQKNKIYPFLYMKIKYLFT